MKSLQRHNSRFAIIGVLLGILAMIGGAQAQTTVYPIAVSADVVSSVAPGTVIMDILNGARHGNFGWLTWTGDNSEAALVTSLTGAGNVSAFTNPDNAADHDLSVGDWVFGKLGVSNSSGVRNALDDLEDGEIMLPVWDQVRGSGSSLAYHISGFARVQIKGYRLPGQSRITVLFLGVFDNPAGDDGGGDGGPGV
jgi:hypothetical protein